MKKKGIIYFVIIYVCFGMACNREFPQECKEFYELPIAQQEKVFAGFTTEKQLRVYRCGLYREPPKLSSAYQIADGGEAVIPILMDYLKAEKDQYIQSELIYVFQIMSRKNLLNNRTDVVEELRKIIYEMTSATSKSKAKKALQEIEENVKQNS